MLKDTIVTQEFIVIWFPGTSDITCETKKEFYRDLDYGYFQHDNYKYEEFETFEKADEFVDELWEGVE